MHRSASARRTQGSSSAISIFGGAAIVSDKFMTRAFHGNERSSVFREGSHRQPAKSINTGSLKFDRSPAKGQLPAIPQETGFGAMFGVGTLTVFVSVVIWKPHHDTASPGCFRYRQSQLRGEVFSDYNFCAHRTAVAAAFFKRGLSAKLTAQGDAGRHLLSQWLRDLSRGTGKSALPWPGNVNHCSL